MTVTVPYDWLKQIPKTMLEKDESPLLGAPPPFPWDKFSAIFAKVFQLENLKIEPGQWQVRESKDLLSGLGSKVVPIHCDVAPLQGTVCLVLPEKDIERMMNYLFTKKMQTGEILDPEYKQAFLQFLALETFNIINKLEYDKGLTPHVLDKTDVPNQSGLCQDIKITLDGTAITARLILSDELRNAWKERYAARSVNVSLPTSLAQALTVIVSLSGGKTTLNYSEWNNIHLGDFLILDTCSLDPGEDKGRVILTLNDRPLHRAKIKQGNIKILESPLYQEVDKAMVQKDEHAPEDHDEDFEDDEEFEEELSELEMETPSQEADVAKQAPTAAPIPKASAPTAAPASAEQHKVSAKDIPITITVEVGRVQISVQKLLELQPGNLLELDIHPENGVDLVVHGKIIGKGELLKIGDTLGVRILDKG